MVERPLSAGGFALTYVAWDHQFRDRCVIKELAIAEIMARSGAQMVALPGRSADVAIWVQKVQKEAQVLHSLRSAGVVPVRASWCENGTAYFAMDYIDGIELPGEPMRDVAWSVWEPVATKFLRALGAIHAAGLVHGDIKPQNVLVTSAGNPVIIDFGTARSNADAKKTRLTTIAMTPGYCPPELAVRDRAREMGPWSDLYSWALTVMGLVIRHRGVEGSPLDAAARLALAEHGHSDAGLGAETVTALRGAGVPQAWIEVLIACVALDPAARPRSSEELFAHLEAAKRQPPAVVPSSPPVAPPAPPQVQPVAVPSSANWAAWGVALFMLACCAISVVILVKSIQKLAAVYPLENLPSFRLPEPPEPPEVILNETRVLTEGSYSGRSFGVSGISRVSISVKAKPEPVDFFLLDEEDWAKFRAASEAGRSGGFSYLTKLSSENVLAKEMTADVGPGTWHLIVRRPRDSAFGGDDTAATIVITKQVIIR